MGKINLQNNGKKKSTLSSKSVSVKNKDEGNMLNEKTYPNQDYDDAVATDCKHLSAEIYTTNSRIPYYLANILEKCNHDKLYLKSAEDILVSLASTEEKVKNGLEEIIKNSSDSFNHIKPLAERILEMSNAPVTAKKFRF